MSKNILRLLIGGFVLNAVAVIPLSGTAETVYFNMQGFRLGIDKETAIPDFIGIGPEGSMWVEKNLLPAEPQVALESPGGCRIISVPEVEENSITARIHAGFDAVPVKLEYKLRDNRLLVVFSRERDNNPVIQLAIRIPFDPFVTSTTFLSTIRDEEGNYVLPGVLSAPDHGQLQIELNAAPGKAVKANMVGSRGDHRMTLILQFCLNPGEQVELNVSRFVMPEIPGVPEKYREAVQRAWLNIFTTHAEIDTTIIPHSYPAMYRVPQLLAHNTLSDPNSFMYYHPSDMAFLAEDTPVLSLRRLVQNTISWWLDNKMTERGAAIGYSTGEPHIDYSYFIDSHPSLLIASWNVVESTNDVDWLRKYIRKLEMLGNYLASRDIDKDGIVETERLAGTPDLLAGGGSSKYFPFNRSGQGWIDAINFGHKDAYGNALIYRGWLCLADMENRLGNSSLGMFYTHLAEKLKENYFPVFYDPRAEVLAGWVDANGRKVHYRFPGVNGLAVAVGLLDEEKAAQIMKNMIQNFHNASFLSYQYGVPATLDPIEPFDYLKNGYGYPDPDLPNKNWQVYQNGGISATQTAFYLQGLIRAGYKDEASRILGKMLETQNAGDFQNGIINQYPKGAEWKMWDGEPGGYEGYFACDFYYLISAPLLDGEVYRKLFRPTFK